ncbi:MAG: hypothetical protein ABEJ94_02865 [Halorientalis sp.]
MSERRGRELGRNETIHETVMGAHISEFVTGETAGKGIRARRELAERDEKAVATIEGTVVRDVERNSPCGSVRESAPDHGLRSLAAVPFTHRTVTHGVLVVYADRAVVAVGEVARCVGFSLRMPTVRVCRVICRRKHRRKSRSYRTYRRRHSRSPPRNSRPRHS